MMDLLFILLMQTAAGDPTAAQPAQTQTTEEAPATEQRQTISRDQVVVLVPDERAYEGVRCERIATTGSRVRREVVCTTDQTRRDTRETAEWIANSAGSASRVGDR